MANVYPVTRVIMKKDGETTEPKSLEQIIGVIDGIFNLHNPHKNLIIIDYNVSTQIRCSAGWVAPHVTDKSKLTLAATHSGKSGTLLEVRSKLVFEVN